MLFLSRPGEIPFWQGGDIKQIEMGCKQLYLKPIRMNKQEIDKSLL